MCNKKVLFRKNQYVLFITGPFGHALKEDAGISLHTHLRHWSNASIERDFNVIETCLCTITNTPDQARDKQPLYWDPFDKVVRYYQTQANRSMSVPNQALLEDPQLWDVLPQSVISRHVSQIAA
jgi:hypothetical protein